MTSLNETVAMMGTREPDMRFQLYRRLKDAVGAFGQDNWWMYREATRFITGIYQPILPFDNEWFGNITMSRAFLGSFPHIAEDPTLVSWIPDTTYGVQDKRVVGKPGRLLQTFFGLEDSQIAHYVNKFNAEQRPLELKFTENFEEINTVYQSGPGSCMSKGFAAHANPLKVYDCPHIKLAYALDRGRIVARTVVRTDRTPWQFTRIYGNEFALLNLLCKQGHKRATDGLTGIVLGEPHLAPGINRILIAYLDSPSSHVLLDWEAHTLTVSIDRPTKPSQHQISATNADGLIALPAHIFIAWQTGKYVDPITKKRVSPLDRFWGNYDQDDDGQLVCNECEEHFHPDQCEANWQGRPVCSDCIDEYYCWAIVNENGRREWVHQDDDGLMRIDCIDDFCCGVEPSAVFDIVENIYGDWIRNEDSVHSALQDGYILERTSFAVYRHASPVDGFSEEELNSQDRTLFYLDRVEEQWLDFNSERVVFISDVRVRRSFTHRIYILEERSAHDIEEIGSQVAEEISAARRSVLAERPAEFAERLAALARSAESDRDSAHLLAGVPGFISTLVRNRIAEIEVAARTPQPRSAA